MPMPNEYQRVGEDFDAFLLAVVDATGLATRNQAYTTTEGVLHAFRRRLAMRDALRFANVLPPVIRAIFIADWSLNEPILPFATRETMTLEVKQLRRDHNFSPDTAIRDVAKALRRSVDEKKFDAMLATLPQGAKAFWEVN
jgi:uncharacterized protein (DUF2267 family)